MGLLVCVLYIAEESLVHHSAARRDLRGGDDPCASAG